MSNSYGNVKNIVQLCSLRLTDFIPLHSPHSVFRRFFWRSFVHFAWVSLSLGRSLLRSTLWNPLMVNIGYIEILIFLLFFIWLALFKFEGFHYMDQSFDWDPASIANYGHDPFLEFTNITSYIANLTSQCSIWGLSLLYMPTARVFWGYIFSWDRVIAFLFSPV